MDTIKDMINTVVSSIVDDLEKVSISTTEEESGTLYEIQVGRDDAGKLIGKGGRIASALRTLAKAAGAKQGKRVMLNVHKDPVDPVGQVDPVAPADPVDPVAPADPVE